MESEATDEKMTESMNRVKKVLERQTAVSSIDWHPEQSSDSEQTSDPLLEEQVSDSSILPEKRAADLLPEEHYQENYLLLPSSTLRPQISSTSMCTDDSGITSRNLSSSSLVPPDFPSSNFAPSEAAIAENNEQLEQLLSPVNYVEEATSGTSDETGASMKQESTYRLHIPLGSTTPTSDRCETSPTSSQSISMSSSTSSSSTPQEVRVKVEINLPDSKKAITVNTSAMVCRKLRQLQLNFSFMPTHPTRKVQRRCSTPSPKLDKQERSWKKQERSKKKQKGKGNSKSFDEKSPTNASQNVIMASKSFDEVPNSPNTLRKSSSESSPFAVRRHDESSRHLRNQLIASIIQKNMVQFVSSTDIDILSSHLFAEQLLSSKDVEELNGIKSVRGRNNFLYMLLLPNKGVNAYQKFFHCLRAETHHCGHIDLAMIINSELLEE